MKITPFALSLALVIVIGGAAGGLTGALTSDDDEPAQGSLAVAQPGAGPTGDGGDAIDAQDIRERIQSGDVTPGELAELRDRFQQQRGQGAAAAPDGGSGDTRTGAIEGIEGGTLLLSGANGTTSVSVGGGYQDPTLRGRRPG